MGIICPRATSHVTNHVISRNQRDPFLYNDRLLDNREFLFPSFFKTIIVFRMVPIPSQSPARNDPEYSYDVARYEL